MLKLTGRQMKIMEDHVLCQRLLPTLRDQFPARVTALGHDLHATITAALRRAREYGFRETGDLSKYVLLAFAFSPAFDHDPACPWAAQILSNREIPTPEMRMELLLSAAIEALRPVDEAAGDDEDVSQDESDEDEQDEAEPNEEFEPADYDDGADMDTDDTAEDRDAGTATGTDWMPIELIAETSAATA
jgi:hypothetical protein